MNPARELRKIASEFENKREAESKVKVEKLDNHTIVISGLPAKAIALAEKYMKLDLAGEDASDAGMEMDEELNKIGDQLETEGKIDSTLLESAFSDPVYVVSAVKGNRVIKTRHREKSEADD